MLRFAAIRRNTLLGINTFEPYLCVTREGPTRTLYRVIPHEGEIVFRNFSFRIDENYVMLLQKLNARNSVLCTVAL